MKNYLLCSFALLVCFFSAPAQTEKNTDTLRSRVLTRDAMQADFNYMRKALEETHPGLYRYNTKEQLTQKMDSLSALLKGGMKFYDYYRLLALLIAQIRCAHTNILPSPDLGKFMSTCKTFPYWVFLIEGHIYLTGIGTSDTIVKPGYELVSINGNTVDAIKAIIYKHLWGDGYIDISRQRMLDEQFFSLFYYLFVEQPGTFTIQCKTPDGKIIEHNTVARTLPDAERNLIQNPVNQELLKAHAARNRLNQKNRWRVEINKEVDAAIITITNFGGGKNADEATKLMHEFMDGAMEKISKTKVNNLIIDLRLNHGGWDSQGEELFTYLTAKPAYYYRSLHTVTNNSAFLQYSSISKTELANIQNELTPEAEGTFTVKSAYNSSLLQQQPKPNRFNGKIYFLMDGASGSTTAEFLAVAHNNNVGTFIGEECAGNYTGGNGGEFISLLLPQTKIQISIPLEYYENAVDEPVNKGRGTMPDYAVPYNINDILTGTDTQLNFTFDFIKKTK